MLSAVKKHIPCRLADFHDFTRRLIRRCKLIRKHIFKQRLLKRHLRRKGSLPASEKRRYPKERILAAL